VVFGTPVKPTRGPTAFEPLAGEGVAAEPNVGGPEFDRVVGVSRYGAPRSAPGSAPGPARYRSNRPRPFAWLNHALSGCRLSGEWAGQGSNLRPWD
jgi:hypothetical protein